MLTQERLKELLHYDPETGLFTWINGGRGTGGAGSLAGCDGGLGYINIRHKGIVYRAHRLVFLYMEGKYPPDCVDHIDGNRSNNRLSNLRHASRSENNWNIKLDPRSTTGVKGVYFSKKDGSYMARISVSGKRVYIGSYKDIESAKIAIEKARGYMHGEYANHG